MRARRLCGLAAASAYALATFALAIAACGETRRPIGEECLRGEDCLSGQCAARVCIAPPTLLVAAGNAPAIDAPRMPLPDGDASLDAPAEAN
jgi:hypothetical protein